MTEWSRRRWLGCGAALFASGALSCHSDPAEPAAPTAPVSKRQQTHRSPPEEKTELPRAENKRGDESQTEPEPEPARPSLRKIYIQPLGRELPQADVDFVKQALGAFFPHPVVLSPAVELPQEAYYPPRSRYRAEKILAFLQSITADDAQVVMGLTGVDISTTKGSYEDWGILGLATVGGEQCVISRFRAARGARDAQHTRIRLAKTVVHEVGHTLGLLHCPNHGCLMEDGKGTVKTTDHEYDLCDTCRAQVGKAVLSRGDVEIPWPSPL